MANHAPHTLLRFGIGLCLQLCRRHREQLRILSYHSLELLFPKHAFERARVLRHSCLDNSLLCSHAVDPNHHAAGCSLH